jgi:hypothetical protein
MGPRSLALFGALCCSCGACSSTPTATADGGLTAGDLSFVQSVTDLGALSMPAHVLGRDGAASGLVGTQVLWTFDDTLMSQPGADGLNYRTSTAALGAPTGSITALTDTLDDAGAPVEFIPYSAAEAAYNFGPDGGPDNRIALWPASVANLGGSSGSSYVVAFNRLHIYPGVLNYQPLGVGLATVMPGSTTASRDPADLFVSPDPQYSLGGLVDGGTLYLYACTSNGTLDTPCTVAEAPVASAHQRSAYTFWDGNEWNPDAGAAATVFSGAPGDCSVSWNAHLGSYIAVHSQIFGNNIYLHTAPTPQGPWSAPVLLFTAAAPGAGQSNDYAGKEHSELSSNGGQTIVVTYAHPLAAFSEEIRVVAVSLK